jgi:hypothetical protein
MPEHPLPERQLPELPWPEYPWNPLFYIPRPAPAGEDPKPIRDLGAMGDHLPSSSPSTARIEFHPPRRNFLSPWDPPPPSSQTVSSSPEHKVWRLSLSDIERKAWNEANGNIANWRSILRDQNNQSRRSAPSLFPLAGFTRMEHQERCFGKGGRLGRSLDEFARAGPKDEDGRKSKDFTGDEKERKAAACAGMAHQTNDGQVLSTSKHS